MSVNTESLQALLLEMNDQLRKHSNELQAVEAQLDNLNTKSLINKATLKELKPSDEKVWKGVGKMFLSVGSTEYEETVDKEEAATKEQTKALEIKKDYLKTSLETTSKNMNAILTGKKL